MRPNIQYELFAYEQLVASIDSSGTALTDSTDMTVFSDSVQIEVAKVKNRLISEVLAFDNERHLERYIQYHQQALVRLMDEMLLRSRNATREKRERFALCYNGVEGLLTFVEGYFAKYFNQDGKAPTAYASIVQNDIGLHFQDISDKLYELNAEEGLAESVLHALKKVVEGDVDKEISYRKVFFAREVQKELGRLLKRVQVESFDQLDINEELRQIVYYLNYNSFRAFSYHENYIGVILSETDSRDEMIERLSFVLKKVNQARVKPGVAYNTQAPALKDQLSGYIIEEIEHLQRLGRLGQATTSRAAETHKHFKVHVEMSVAQIALFVRVLVESKIIKSENVTELLRFLSSILVSKRKDDISFDSLRAKYYNIEQSTKETVRSILGTLVNSIGRTGTI
ncbi:MAG: hypothetical protein QM762_26250 [Chryseolinea sp.]